MTNFALAFLFISVVFLIIFIFFSIFNYKNRFHMSYDLRNHYPYELNYEGKFKDNLIGNLAICLYSGSSIAFYCLFDPSFTNGFLVFTLIAGTLLSLSLLSLVFIPLKALKTHLIMVLIAVVLAFLIPFSNAMACAINYRDTSSVSSLVMMIANSIYCLFIFFLIMNPKLSHWAELKEEKSPDGTKKYVRPKIFILALIEWLLIITNVLVMVLTILTKTLAL
ncbi:MAG: hypothetical protein K5906_02870 [Bacilli bacterium]|nr:hypothetical protein [Bacilli bacterium]